MSEGFYGPLTPAYVPGQPAPADATGNQSDTWLDAGPTNDKNPWPFQPAQGDGTDVLAKVAADSNHMSPGYGPDMSNTNAFPKGSGPDMIGQNLRGYVLNEGDPGVSLDLEGPNTGPLWKPKFHEVGGTAPMPMDVSKAGPVGPSHAPTSDSYVRGANQNTRGGNGRTSGD